MAKIEHHTVADWDFAGGAAYRSLSATYYVSAPTSLKLLKPAAPTFNEAVLCHIPETQLVAQGELRSWYRYPVVSGRLFTFRNQAALGSANVNNCYLLLIAATTVYLFRCIGGGEIEVGHTSCRSSANTWEHWRVIWYNGHTPADAEAICVDVYKEIAGEWVKQGSTLYDTWNQFKDSAINRCGLCSQLIGGWAYYHDDTEIWGVV